MKKPILYITVGIPGSGKSTYCKTKLSHIKHISRDEVRFSLLKPNMTYFAVEKQVYNLWTSKIKDALLSGLDVIADATHLNWISRSDLILTLKKKGLDYKDYNIIFLCFDTPLNIALAQNFQRKGREIVPENTIKEMFNRLNFPKIEEFENCIGVNIIKYEKNIN